MSFIHEQILQQIKSYTSIEYRSAKSTDYKKNMVNSTLEVESKDKNGNTTWKPVANLGNTVSSSVSSNQQEPSINSSENEDTTKEKYPHRKNLPMRVKHFLSPNATIKAHRKANYLYRHSYDKTDTNLLILIHGAGDSHQAYHAFAKKMNLPQCATLSLHASSINKGFVTLPFDLGYTWFEEMDYTTGEDLRKGDDRIFSSLDKAIHHLDSLIDLLSGKEKADDNDSDYWIPERIFLFGFSAGASLAMETCLYRFIHGKQALGGAFCVCGGLQHGRNEQEICHGDVQVCATPIKILVGGDDTKFSVEDSRVSVTNYNQYAFSENIQRVTNAGQLTGATSFVKPFKVHSMIQDEEETRVLMGFFAEYMVRRMTAMEGFCEIPSEHFQSSK